MELGEGLSKRLAGLEKLAPDIPRRLAAIAEKATLRAVDEAAAQTPPNTFAHGELRGVNTISGELAQHWAADSQIVPVASGEELITALANDMEYASYVNDGHRVDRHFVPGLYIDEDGLLSMDLGKPKGVGLMVGTKTSYVEGLHITDKAIDRYDEVARAGLEKLTREMGQ